MKLRKLRWPFWMSTVMAVVLLGTLGGSVFADWKTGWLGQGSVSGVGVNSAVLVVLHGDPGDWQPRQGTGWFLDCRRRMFPFHWRWLPRYEHYLQPQRGTLVFIPLYLLATPFVIASTVMFVRSRRALPGHCVNCGYDLAGLETGKCPECGEEKKE